MCAGKGRMAGARAWPLPYCRTTARRKTASPAHQSQSTPTIRLPPTQLPFAVVASHCTAPTPGYLEALVSSSKLTIFVGIESRWPSRVRPAFIHESVCAESAHPLADGARRDRCPAPLPAGTDHPHGLYRRTRHLAHRGVAALRSIGA